MRVNVTRFGSGPPLVFLHGIGSSSATWARVMELLGEHHTVAAIDLMGHGGSPVPDDPAEYTRDRALDDIDELLVTFDEPAVLVGHSLGGYLALAHAATRPGVARGIVVLNTGPGFRDPEKREAWNERSRRNAHRFGVVPQAAELNLQADSVVMDRVAEMTVPTLILAGSADRPEYTGAGRYLESKMANARFSSVEGGDHAMHEETHAVEIAARIEAFVTQLSTATASAPLVVGLTGGIGAGKSTVARALAERGAEVIDMDRLGHVVLEPGGRAHDALIAEFGEGILDADRTISRPALGSVVFGDPDALARLNGISHPAMNAELTERLRASDAEIVVLDMAVLVESHLGRLDPPYGYTIVITVEAPVELRVARAVARGMDEADARRRVERQASEADRRAVADRVIVNDADEAALIAQVDECWEWLLGQAAGRASAGTDRPSD